MLESNCPDLPLLARGKVRDIYSIPEYDDRLLFVASDRISAYDVILGNVSSVCQYGQREDRTGVLSAHLGLT